MPSSPPDASQELANRAEEVYSGAVDGIDSSELGTVVEELEAGAEALRVRHKGLLSLEDGAESWHVHCPSNLCK